MCSNLCPGEQKERVMEELSESQIEKDCNADVNNLMSQMEITFESPSDRMKMVYYLLQQAWIKGSQHALKSLR